MEDEDAEEKKIKVGTVGEWEERTPVPKHLSSKRFKLPCRKRSGGVYAQGFPVPLAKAVLGGIRFISKCSNNQI